MFSTLPLNNINSFKSVAFSVFKLENFGQMLTKQKKNIKPSEDYESNVAQMIIVKRACSEQGIVVTASVYVRVFLAVGDAHVFPGFLTPVLTQLFFPKPPTTFLTCFCRGER